jgi:hypothetical protein
MQDSKPDRQQPKNSPADATAPEPDAVLGNVGAGPHDTELNPPAPHAPISHRKETAQPPAAVTPTGQPAPPETDLLRLPRGGLVAMRQSGGLRFRSREIVVYRSGKAVYRQLAPTGEEPASDTRQLHLSELVKLHHLLKQSNFAKLLVVGRQNPDAFAYEIVARVGRRIHFVEAFEGSIPESLAPLIRKLQGLMHADQENT